MFLNVLWEGMTLHKFILNIANIKYKMIFIFFLFTPMFHGSQNTGLRQEHYKVMLTSHSQNLTLCIMVCIQIHYTTIVTMF